MESEKRKQSIFERIQRAITGTGFLPDHFHGEEEEPGDGTLKFMPGALEGILNHHSSGKNGDKQHRDRAISAFLKDHLTDDFETTIRLYERQWGSLNIAPFRDSIPLLILEKKEEYDAGRLAALAYAFMTKAVKAEAVKMGLVLMTLFDTTEDAATKEAFRTLGCCEDFTDYVLRNTTDWPDDERNQFCFALAKRLHGWGKINAVERLNANTDEIREWLLGEGCKNTILYGYLGLECAEKCDYKNRLQKGGLTESELSGAYDIMEGLLDEGPCSGIRALSDPEETIYWYLCANEGKTVDAAYLKQLLSIHSFLNGNCTQSSDETDTQAVSQTTVSGKTRWRERADAKLTGLFDTIDTREIIVRGLQENPYDAVCTAQTLRIDISDQLLAQMRRDFETYYRFGYYFLRPAESTPRTRRLAAGYIDLCETHLDYSRLPEQAGSAPIHDGCRHWNVDMAVQYLDQYPGLGKELIRVSLHSHRVRWRSMAVKALFGWKTALGTTLEEYAPELSADVRRAAGLENDHRLTERFAELLT